MTAPMTSREALHPTQMSNQELAGALDDYRHWTVLEETTQDLLNAASQRLRAVAQNAVSHTQIEAGAKAILFELTNGTQLHGAVWEQQPAEVKSHWMRCANVCLLAALSPVPSTDRGGE